MGDAVSNGQDPIIVSGPVQISFMICKRESSNKKLAQEGGGVTTTQKTLEGLSLRVRTKK